jgi:hypothetical protein
MNIVFNGTHFTGIVKSDFLEIIESHANNIKVAQSVSWLTTDWTTGVRSPTENFSSSPCVHTGSGAHPAPIQWVPGFLSPGVKRGRVVMLTTHPYLVPRSRMSRIFPPPPPKRLHGVKRDNLWKRQCTLWITHTHTHMCSRRQFIRKSEHREHSNNVIIERRFGIVVPKAITDVSNFLTTCAVVDGS